MEKPCAATCRLCRGGFHGRRICFCSDTGFLRFCCRLFCHPRLSSVDVGPALGAGIAPFGPFPSAPTHPFRVPAVISLAFWGGIWGILFALIEVAFPRRWGYWVTAILFGAILPSLVALLVVLPLKGLTMGGGSHFPLFLTALLINGAWGLGTGIFFRAFLAWLRVSCSPLETHGKA